MSIWTASSMSSAVPLAGGPWQWQILQRGTLCLRRSPRALLYDPKAPQLTSTPYGCILLTIATEAWWKHTLASPMPIWNQKSNTSATGCKETRLLQMFSSTYMRLEKQTPKCHSRRAVAFRRKDWIKMSSTLKDFFFILNCLHFLLCFVHVYFLKQWSVFLWVFKKIYIYVLFALLQNAIKLQYDICDFWLGRPELCVVWSRAHPQGESESQS